MKSLLTKFHYHYHEEGEFEGEMKRSLQETKEVIDQFPWQKVRQNFVVGLSAPSVTIENDHGAYLRLSLYYHDKFVLYYFDREHKLYKWSFTDLADAYPHIDNFFTSDKFNTDQFKLENAAFQGVLSHFATNDFRYSMKPVKTILFFLLTNGISIAVLAMIIFTLITQGSNMPLFGIIFLSIFLIFPGLLLFVFFNHYNYARNKVLVLSKGTDSFFFGAQINPTRYSKKDIATITLKKVKGDRNPLGFFSVTTIEFKDGSCIFFPNMLMGELTQLSKLLVGNTTYGFPIIS